MAGKTWSEKKNTLQPSLRNGLLAALIALPFGLYLSLNSGLAALAYVLAGLLALCMAVLVWLG